MTRYIKDKEHDVIWYELAGYETETQKIRRLAERQQKRREFLYQFAAVLAVAIASIAVFTVGKFWSMGPVL